MATRPYQTHDVTLAAGNRLRYYEWFNQDSGSGSGLNLVLLHGSGSYGLQWEWVAEHLDERMHVFALDQRGHGESSRPDGEYSAEEGAADVQQFVAALGLGQIVVAGNSLGGRVAQVFAAEYPRLCAGAVILAAHLSNFYHDRERMASVLRSACSMLNSPTEFPSRDAAMAYLKETRGSRETEASLNHRIDHGMEQVGSGYRVKHDPVRVAQGLTHMAKDLRAYATRATCPVLLVRSTIDSELSPEVAMNIAGLWSRGQTVDVEGGYLLYVQNPRGTAQTINAFVQSLSGAVPSAQTA